MKQTQGQKKLSRQARIEESKRLERKWKPSLAIRHANTRSRANATRLDAEYRHRTGDYKLPPL